MPATTSGARACHAAPLGSGSTCTFLPMCRLVRLRLRAKLSLRRLVVSLAERFNLSGRVSGLLSRQVRCARRQLFFLQQNATTACDGLLHNLRKFVKQPGQCHLQLNVIVGDINSSCRDLAKGADAKRHPVSRPGLLLHHEHGKAGGGLAQRRLDATQSLFLAEFVRKLDD